MLIKFIFLSLTRVYSTGIGFLLILLSAEILGLDIRGKIAIAVTWMTAFFTFLHLSIGQLGYKIVIDDKNKTSEVISYFIVYDFIITLSLAVVLPVIFHLFIPASKISLFELYFSLLLVPVMMLEQQLLTLFLAYNDTNVLNKLSIINRTLNLLLTSILIFISPNYFTFIVCLFLLSASMAYSYYAKINHNFSYKFINYNFINLIKNGINFHFFNAFGYIGYTLLPLLILPTYVASNEFALYEIGFKLISLVMIIATSCQLLAIRVFSKENDIKKGWNQYLKIVFIYFLISYMVVLSYILIYPYIIKIEYFSKYFISLTTLYELIPYIPLIGTTAFLPTLFVNLNLLKLSALYNFILGIFCFSLLFTLSKLYNIDGIFIGLKFVYGISGVLFLAIMFFIYYTKIKVIPDVC
ncbi:MATE family efflux transporter [Providencia heimbachae]|uniref:O-antigen flippase n=1 Tax=Providencia heimbachae ATCC 35613 TaxID=1354272 RepID=A0A1B7JUV7_9GAMM|nr:hypothetical protein [Providencia heimbachae]OAT51689.1 hypothetical protein M998_2035 [Providencia heimbachae ATCC 35613]SQH15811.1 Uncharacterised protein [Providencia heimbachae]